MAFTITASLMDAVVLTIVSKDVDGTYGYKITQDIRSVMDLSESTLYPVLRRLQKNLLLETYDKEFQGRNRRYYRITPKGTQQLTLYHNDWVSFKKQLDPIFLGGITHDKN